MTALPKAISQGSNGAGATGAGAFRGISAANAEPAVTASSAAAKTSFFMTIPITFQKQSGSDAPRKRQPAATKFLDREPNLEVADHRGKQKRRASADFLGDTDIPGNVVGGCCIPTTTFTDSRRRGGTSGLYPEAPDTSPPSMPDLVARRTDRISFFSAAVGVRPTMKAPADLTFSASKRPQRRRALRPKTRSAVTWTLSGYLFVVSARG